MKRLLIAFFVTCMVAGCNAETETGETIKLPPQDSAIDIDHRVPPDSVPATDTARVRPVY